MELTKEASRKLRDHERRFYSEKAIDEMNAKAAKTGAPPIVVDTQS